MDEAEPDRFVEQLRWVAREAGGVKELARRSRVSTRTLQSWLAGRYPRQRSSKKLTQLDDWALSHLPGYPPEGTSSLADLAGPVGLLAEQEPPPRPEWGRGGADNGPPGPDRPAQRSHRAVIIGLVIGGVLVVAGVLLGIKLVDRGSSEADGPDDTTIPSVQAYSSTIVDSFGGLPSGPVDSRVSEQTGKFGANTFADPRTGSGQGTVIPPFTTVMVQCRFYSPIMTSLEPDGYWYLIVDEPWANTWAPANSFMNGDEVGQPVQHNTDLAVPVCQ